MIPHYHIFMGAANVAPMQSTKIDDFDESIKQFSRLATAVFGDWEFYDLSFKNLLVTSEFGAKQRMTLGTEMLCIQWHRCDSTCASPSWN
jgi:hypothetical protein